jgi:hypothetical protein
MPRYHLEQHAFVTARVPDTNLVSDLQEAKVRFSGQVENRWLSVCGSSCQLQHGQPTATDRLPCLWSLLRHTRACRRRRRPERLAGAIAPPCISVAQATRTQRNRTPATNKRSCCYSQRTSFDAAGKDGPTLARERPSHRSSGPAFPARCGVRLSVRVRIGRYGMPMVKISPVIANDGLRAIPLRRKSS